LDEKRDVESMGKDFDWGGKEICYVDAISQQNCYNYIPCVRIVDGRDGDIAEEISDPGICLLDYWKAHVSVNRQHSGCIGMS